MGLGLVKNKLNKFIKAADIDAILQEIIKEDGFQKFLISLNQNDQLFDLGIDSLGASLGEYADFTKVEKKRKGDPFDRITLLDDGLFYASFRIELGGSSFLFQITANPKRGDSDLFTDFGKKIIGWTEENVQRIIDAIRERIVPIIKRRMAA